MFNNERHVRLIHFPSNPIDIVYDAIVIVLLRFRCHFLKIIKTIIYTRLMSNFNDRIEINNSTSVIVISTSFEFCNNLDLSVTVFTQPNLGLR